MTNLYLLMLDKMGAHTEKLGDSTGETTHLTDVWFSAEDGGPGFKSNPVH